LDFSIVFVFLSDSNDCPVLLDRSDSFVDLSDFFIFSVDLSRDRVEVDFSKDFPDFSVDSLVEPLPDFSDVFSESFLF